MFWKFTKFQQLPFGEFFEIVNIEITALVQSIWWSILGSEYLFTDMGFFIVLSHIKLHLTNLQICIQNLLKYSVRDSLKSTSSNGIHEEYILEWKYVEERLKQIVSYHTAILDVSKLVDEAFNLSHLVKFVCLSYCMCLLIQGISKIRVSDGLFWLLSLYLITLIILMNIVNYYGNEIVIESQNIANCCYNIEFVGTNIKLQKSLVLTIQRSQRPIVMTVAYLTCLSVVVKRNHLVKVFETLENGIFLPNSDRGGIEEKHLMDSWIASLNKLGLLTSPIVAIMVICTYTIWKFTKYLQLPFGVFVGIINDEITAFIQCVWFCSMGLGYFFIHVTFFTILSHIKLHLTNLQTCIKHLLQNSSDDYLKNKSDNELNEDHVIQWKYLQIRLQQVVDYHSAILDVSKLIDKAFNLCHLVKCISVSYLLCLLIHGISKISISDGLFWLLSSYIAILIVLMHVVNYYGNEIIIESQNIANCCYNIEFVGTNIKLQKGLLLMIQRSQRPIVMTVGKFAPLSIATSIANTPRSSDHLKMSERPVLETSQRLLQIVDLSPKKRSRAGSIFRKFSTVLLVIHSILLVYEPIAHWKGVSTLEYLGEFVVAHYQSLCKLVITILNRDKINRLFQKMDEFKKLESLDVHLRTKLSAIFKKWDIGIKLYVGNGCLCGSMIILSPLFTSRGNLPVPLYAFGYENKSPSYEFLFVLETIQYGYMTILEMALDMMFFSFIICIYYELMIINYQFEHFDDKNTERFGEIIDHHNFTLSCISDLNSIYVMSFLNQLLSNMSLICMSMLVLISEENISATLLASHGFFLISVFMQLFCYCLAGTKINEEGSKALVVIFHAPWWIDAPMNLKRNVINVMQKAQQGVKISAGGMFDMDLNLCTKNNIIPYYPTAFLSGVSLIIKKNHLIKVFETLENGIFLPNIDRGGAEEKELMNDWITSLNKLVRNSSTLITNKGI
ncbi:hypothetical protein FQR65_LT00691 [Abscondita terminalis]|nr:hypothetical protein FQR65_LT00691 [Abscondita terminalis]